MTQLVSLPASTALAVNRPSPAGSGRPETAPDVLAFRRLTKRYRSGPLHSMT